MDNFSFYLFLRGVRTGFERGDLQVSVPLSELDLAIQYVIGKEQQARGTLRLELSPEDIALLIRKYCGAEVYDRVFSEEPRDLSDKALSDMLSGTVAIIREKVGA